MPIISWDEVVGISDTYGNVRCVDSLRDWDEIDIEADQIITMSDVVNLEGVYICDYCLKSHRLFDPFDPFPIGLVDGPDSL